MRSILTAIALFALIPSWAQQDHFVTTWSTGNTLPPGSSGPTMIVIPTTGSGYDYDVDWDNDGVFDEFGITGNATHDFGVAGTYTIRITGSFPRIFFNNSGDTWKLISIDQWGNNPWTSMNGAFRGCRNPVINATDTPDLSNVTDMTRMFGSSNEFNSDIGSWDVSNVTNMSGLFDRAVMFNQNLSNWDVSNVTDMNRLFKEAWDYDQPLNSWDVGNVTDMTYMFEDASSFNQPLNNWNVSSVTDMHHMFWRNDSFNGDIGTWDVSNVTNMTAVFNAALAFNQPLDAWDVSSVTNMTQLFSAATSFNQPLNSWNIGSPSMFAMFAHATAFNQPLDAWDMSNVTAVTNMFWAASSFDQDISMWDMSAQPNTSGMFREATSFDQDLANWDIGNVTDMSEMFREATAFDQNLGSWDIGNVTDMSEMFFNTSLSLSNYDQTLIGWAAQSVQSNVPFDAGSSMYCAGETAHNALVNTHGWMITDGGLDCSTVGVQELGKELAIYPVPAVDELRIERPNSNINEVVIYSALGDRIEARVRNGRIDVSDLAPGAYTLIAIIDNGPITKKFMVQ
jgi:surface protein